MKKCKHKYKVDLSHGLGEKRHYYCSDCGSHWYNGKFWTKAEWDEWVNGVFDNEHE